MVDMNKLKELVEQEPTPTLQEIGDTLGVSKQRVAQVLRRERIKKPRARGPELRQQIKETAHRRQEMQTCPECGGHKTKSAETCQKCFGVKNRGKGWWLGTDGYVHYARHKEKNGEILEHRQVMSEVLGRPLEKGEVVYHKNGVRNDNRPENLMVTTRANIAKLAREKKATGETNG